MPALKNWHTAIRLSLIAWTVLTGTQLWGDGVRRGDADRLPQPRETREEAGDYLYGRTVIYRSGEMPKIRPTGDDAQRPAAERVRRTHYLQTPLPVMIQGAPNRWAMRRYTATG
ncbi:MAG TPA: hypothetical protein VHC22_00600 [Pirellulales bacterium]|nr:hypothetical protein [Pirellulales bacterium]